MPYRLQWQRIKVSKATKTNIRFKGPKQTDNVNMRTKIKKDHTEIYKFIDAASKVRKKLQMQWQHLKHHRLNV